MSAERRTDPALSRNRSHRLSGGGAFTQPAVNWPCLPNLLSRLWNQYADVLSVEVGTQRLDYLLWVGLDFTHTFATQDADAEHLAVGMLALEGVVTVAVRGHDT